MFHTMIFVAFTYKKIANSNDENCKLIKFWHVKSFYFVHIDSPFFFLFMGPPLCFGQIIFLMYTSYCSYARPAQSGPMW